MVLLTEINIKYFAQVSSTCNTAADLECQQTNWTNKTSYLFSSKNNNMLPLSCIFNKQTAWCNLHCCFEFLIFVLEEC